MAHEVETMFSVREVPWHKLGLVIAEAPKTAADAIRLAGLDWQVEKRPIFVSRDGNGTLAEAPDHRAVVRVTDGKVLGVVGKRYEPVQNAEAFTMVDPLVQAGRLQYETAGSLSGGARVWMLARMAGDDLQVVAGDLVRRFLLVTGSHDGTGGYVVKLTATRVVCANTMAVALLGSGETASLRHTATVHTRIADLGRVLEAADGSFAAALAQWQQLAEVKVDAEALDAYLLRLIPKTEEGVNDTRRANVRGLIRDAFRAAPGNDLPGVRGTAWAAYNAVTWYVTHERGGNDTRLDAQWFGEGAKLARRALQEAMAIAA